MKKQQTQEQITLSAYEKRAAQEIFYNMMEVLEKYIEKANYYPEDWQTRKKIYDGRVTRIFDDVEEAESVFSTNLFGLKITLRNKPSFLIEELKEEYYKWINAVGIDVNNCPERLKHYLLEINEVLEGKGEKFAEAVAKEAHEHVEKMNDEEFSRKMNEAFGAYNFPLNEERKIADSLKGKTYKDMETKSKFSGNVEQGEQTLNQIAGVVSTSHGDFNYFPQKGGQQQQSTFNLTGDENSDIIRNVRQNRNNWRIENIQGQTWLIHSSAQGTDSEAGTLIHNQGRFTDNEW